MLIISKKDGAISTAGAAKKGNKGRLELAAYRDGNNFHVDFKDYGNYGRIRWEADFGDLTEHDIDDMIELLQELRSGAIDSTALEFQVPQTEAEVEAEVVEDELLDDEDEDEIPLQAIDDTDDTEQLEV